MLATMKTSALLIAFGILLPLLPGQSTFADLERKFRAEVQELSKKDPGRAERERQLQQHRGDLHAFVATAKGDDRWNARLMLADLSMALGDRAAAAAALEAIDVEQAPGLVLVIAASMAQHLGRRELRDAAVAKSIGKAGPLADRLAMARMLMTVLHEIERGEQIYTQALAAASDDEQRSFVRWQRADAMRDREDLPENAGFDELERLAKDLPDTYWGGVARDRLRATRLALGDAAIDGKVRTIDGKDLRLADLRGKIVVLAFWSIGDFDTPRLADTLRQLQRSHGDKLAIVAVCLDRDAAAIQAAARELQIVGAVVGDGKGIENDLALRWFVEGPVIHVIDAHGKVAGLGLQTGTADGRQQLLSTVEKLID
jgi:hypothetical protein